MNDQNPFFDRTELDELDDQIEAYTGRPTLVSRLKKRVQKADEENRDIFNLADEIRENAWLYFFLFVSAIFTGTLGIVMGLDPHRDAVNQVIVYNTDIFHLFLSAIYCVAFVAVTEVAFAIYKRLYFTREENNTAQRFASISGMVVSALSIMGTGIAGGMVIASTITFLTDYAVIPEKAQTWVIVAIPLLMSFYAITGSIYVLSSERAAMERLARESERTSVMDHRARMRAIMRMGTERLQVDLIRQYQNAVLNGNLSLADAQAAMDQGKTLAMLERERGEDLDANGRVGVVDPVDDTLSPMQPPR